MEEIRQRTTRKGSFYGWACQIAYFEILQLRRKSQRLQTLSEEALAVLANEALREPTI